MTAWRNEKAELTPDERDTAEVVVLPELTEEAEERIFAKIQASIGVENEEDMEDIGKGRGDGPDR